MVFAAVLMLLAPLQAQEDKEKAKQQEEQAKKKIAEFKEAFAKAAPADKPACIVKLGEMQHPKILDELFKLLVTGEKDCRKAAAGEVARYKNDPKAAAGLLRAASANREAEVIMALLKAVGTVGYRGAAKDLTVFFRHSSTDVSWMAIDTSGALKSKDSVQPLIDLLKELEAIPSSNPGEKQTEKEKRKWALLSPTIASLNRITGQTLSSASEWQRWWEKNARTFKERE